MMKHSRVVFHVDLLQDVSTIRPLARLAASMALPIMILTSPNFKMLDHEHRWKSEIAALAAEINASVHSYESVVHAIQILSPYRGVCIAGSESEVRAHRGTHDLFRALAGDFIRVTLQHGFECVGFLHNERHRTTLGSDIRFAADIIVGWFSAHRLSDVSAHERSKLYVAGPLASIEQTPRDLGRSPQPYVGILCENTHSVRFTGRQMQRAFLAMADNLAAKMASIGLNLHLRPHPAGRFLSRSGYQPHDGMILSDEPLYRQELDRFAFAISAPSTILFDFALAGVPVAVWAPDGMSARNFDGLPTVSTADQCWKFASDSMMMRSSILVAQRRFLDDIVPPYDVRGRYAGLLALAQ
jgi:hypothetical protein